MAFGGEIFAAPSSYGESLDAPALKASLETIGRLGRLATIHAEEAMPGSPPTLPPTTGFVVRQGDPAVRLIAGCGTPATFASAT